MLIGNAGLTTGWDFSSIAEIFLSSGVYGLENIVMVPGKQYSFASFSTEKEAETAVNELNGRNISVKKDIVLYLICVDRSKFILLDYFFLQFNLSIWMSIIKISFKIQV